MADATHRAELKRLIETVPDVGMVYDYRRLATEWDKVLGFFKVVIDGEPLIRGWQVTCVGIGQVGLVQTGVFNTGNQVTYQYVCEGFFSVDDASESEKAALIKSKAVQDAVTSATLFSANDGVIAVSLPVLEFRYRNLGGVICHYAEIKVNITERT